MKRPTDVAKWAGDGFTPDRVKPREAWSKRMERREREFEKAPVDTLLTMAKVAGSTLGPVRHDIVLPVAIRRRMGRNHRYTRFLAMPLNDTHAAIWSPEAGIKVIDRRIVERELWW